jgi:hypothetical protein
MNDARSVSFAIAGKDATSIAASASRARNNGERCVPVIVNLPGCFYRRIAIASHDPKAVF